jgi:hypothetical protein
MDHAHATGTGAAERYVLGEMTEEERARYEEHYFDCPECADDVKAAVVFRESAEAVWRDNAEGAREETLRPIYTEGAASESKRRRFWQLFWPIPQGALVAATLLFCVAGYEALALRGRVRGHEGAAAIESAPWYFLSVAKGSPPIVTVRPGQSRIGLTLSPGSDRTYPYYRCEVQDARGRAMLSGVVVGPAQGQELQLLIPTTSLEPGSYALVVVPLEAAGGPPSSEPPVRYPFALQ